MPMHNPPHPGEMIKEICLPSLGLTIKQAAEGLVCVAAGAVEPHPWADKHHRRYGNSADGGVRIVPRDMASHATRIRSVAGAAQHAASKGHPVLQAAGVARGRIGRGVAVVLLARAP